MIILSSVAFASIPLQCDEQDVACNGAEEIAGLINAEYGGQLIRESAGKKRHRTSTIRKQLQVIINNADRGGCYIESFVGLDINVSGAQFSGSEFVGEAGTVQGNLFFSGTNKGTMGGTNSFGVFGVGEAGFGAFEDFKMVANWDTPQAPGFMAGKYMRAYGNHFVGWGAVGHCSSNPAETFDNWYPGDLSPFYTELGACDIDPGGEECFCEQNPQICFEDICDIEPGGAECCFTNPGHPSCSQPPDPCVPFPTLPTCPDYCLFNPFAPECGPIF